MAIALGTENKRQVYMVAGLFAVIVIISAWELYGSLRSPSMPARLPAAHAPAVLLSAGGNAQRPDVSGIEPKLLIGRLERSEQVDYVTTGRNIFSAESTPVKIETPIAPVRPVEVAVITAPPEPAGPPPMELKYLGYVQGDDKTYDALFIHKDESFVARTGEIMFHRFKVGTILPTGVQVTDLRFNNTQTIVLTEK